jgi:hypothetical protein
MTKLNIAMLLGTLLSVAVAAPASANTLEREAALDVQPTTQMQLSSDRESAYSATELAATVARAPAADRDQGRLSDSSATPAATRRIASLPSASPSMARHVSGPRLRASPLMLGIGY